MTRLAIISLLFISIAVSQSQDAHAQDKAKIQAEYDAWSAKTTATFEKNWASIQALEATVKPVYEKGVALGKAGKTKAAIKTLLNARAKLYGNPNSELIHINKGLSFQIAAALAEQYEKLEDEVHLKREISFMDKGRPWISKEVEYNIFMHYASKEVANVWNYEEYKNEGKRMKTKERKRLKLILKYLVLGGETDILFEEGHNMKKGWQKSLEQSQKAYAKDEFKDYGGQGGIESHDDIYPASRFKKGNLVLVINKKVTKVSGKKAIFDFTTDRVHASGCKSTGKVHRITSRGRYVYKQKCSFSKRRGGHKLIVPMPKGLKLKKGDVVTMYAKVKKSVSDKRKKKFEVTFDTPAVVHASRKGKTQWLLGVKSKKPAHIKPDGDYRVIIKDDAEAPPQVK